ncbi:hypothetical protein D1793_17900 [Halomonas sp. JS92-SW72]|nr:hypothetical protein D1793_17900 [Halomonas sp. JS92-SW72]
MGPSGSTKQLSGLASPSYQPGRLMVSRRSLTLCRLAMYSWTAGRCRWVTSSPISIRISSSLSALPAR